MAISAEDFENAPPSSLDPEASARVKKVVERRDRRRRTERESFTPEETVTQKVPTSQAPPRRVTEIPIVTPTKTRIAPDVIRERVLTARQQRRADEEKEIKETVLDPLETEREKAFQEKIKQKTPKTFKEKVITTARVAIAPGLASREIPEVRSAGVGFVSAGAETVIALQPRNLASFGKSVITTPPRETRDNILSAGAGAGAYIMQPGREGEVFGRIAFDVLAPEIAVKGINVLDVATSGKARLATGGKLTDLPTTKGRTDIALKGGTASTAEPLSEQVVRAGTQVDAVSTGRGFFKTYEPGEIVKIQKEVPPGTPDIETPFFATPKAEARQSRLGLPKPLIETAGAELSFGAGESRQILLFKEQPIAQFPKSLQPAVERVRQGGRFTPEETAQLYKFQTEEGANIFKAPGKTTAESEITLSEGSGVRSEGLIGKSLIKGEVIEIFEASVATPSQVKAYTNLLGETPVRSLGRSAETPTTARITGEDVSIRGSKTRNDVTTQSFSGLEVYTRETPVISTRGRSTGDISRGFIPREQPILRTVTPRKENIYIPIRPKRSGRSGGRTPLASSSFRPSITRTNIPRTPARTNIPRITRTPARPQSPRSTPTQNFFRGASLPKPSTRQRARPFNIQVFKKGRFVTVGKSQTLSGAISKGKSAVGSTALRTFRVRKGLAPVRVTGVQGFRRSKSQPFGVVERSRIAINTGGEIQEISKKGKRRRLL